MLLDPGFQTIKGSTDITWEAHLWLRMCETHAWFLSQINYSQDLLTAKMSWILAVTVGLLPFKWVGAAEASSVILILPV